MRPTSRLSATVKSAAKYLEGNTPTGLTGLTTHPAPRPTLLFTYNRTLQKLKQLPASSVYRQSAEALTKHRLQILEDTKPPGHAEWLQRVQKIIASDPAYKEFQRADGTIEFETLSSVERPMWDGLVTKRDARKEGSNTQTEAEQKGAFVQADVERMDTELKIGQKPTVSDLEVEPALTADQISEIEHKIGAGLIEEIIEVAEGELILVDEMVASRAWENLEEKSPPGQWEYFDRGDRV